MGYYARARNLRRAAQQIVRDHGGELPREEAALRALPGVGRYTVGALRSIAFGERAALVDGNVRRVLARLEGTAELADADAWQLADALVAPDAPGEFNQALMELGATVCTPRNPRCLTCPVHRHCAARATGDPEAYPARKPRRAPVEVRTVAGALWRRGSLLMERRPSRGLLGGLWELPSHAAGAEALAASLRERTGLETRTARALGTLRHLFSHRALTLEIVELERVGGRFRSGSEPLRFCATEELEALPLSTLMKRALAVVR